MTFNLAEYTSKQLSIPLPSTFPAKCESASFTITEKTDGYDLSLFAMIHTDNGFIVDGGYINFNSTSSEKVFNTPDLVEGGSVNIELFTYNPYEPVDDSRNIDSRNPSFGDMLTIERMDIKYDLV